MPCWQAGIDGLFCAAFNRACNRNDRFITQRFHRIKTCIAAVNHTLGDAIMVAQINKDQTTMVTFAMHPSGQADGISNMIKG